MEDKLRLNTKLFSFEGIIGRRDYFLNIIYISCIGTLVTLPMIFWTYTNAETMLDLFVYTNAPIILKLYLAIGSIAIAILSLSNGIRRLNDIFGYINKPVNISYSILILLNALGIFFPFLFSISIGFALIIVGLILLFKKGRITSKYPYDFRKEFNWGAFLGTWIWGLFNKTYVTLWQLIIGLTPWSTLFALICGLKGNEWAFKNKKCNDVEKFNRSQEKQATIWAIFTFIIGPLLYFILIFGLVGIFVFATMEEVKNNPEQTKAKMEKLESGMNNFMDSMVSVYFEKYEITPNENKFYLYDSDWKYSIFSEKKDMLDLAATYSASKREEKDTKNKSYSKTSELPRTKIYSIETGKLLGEFSFEENLLKNPTPMEILKAATKAYKFYNVK